MARVVAVASLGLSLLPRADAWGMDGHKVVASLAEKYLSPAEDAELKKLLGNVSLSEAAVWCDSFDHTAEGHWSEPLHYINYPGHACSFDWARDCKKDFCNAGAIVNYTRQLREPGLSHDRRLFALKFVIHMVGDIHQPLHVGSSEDLGGNTISLDHIDFGHGFQGNWVLHAVWDTLIIEDMILDLPHAEENGKHHEDHWPRLVDALHARLANEWSDQRLAWREATAEVLDEARFRDGLANVAEESAEAGCTYAYTDVDGVRVPKHGNVSKAYYRRATPVVEEQLAKAAVRLSAILSQVLRPVLEETTLVV